ncbi:MAG: WD40 repeat domain-containing protein [Leptolyngbyaceae cyanobacterium bins.349]|nr:WD40 repeat domain-containing protein [Leptolyngbyaceae cyanobacterium bins.349]
MTRQQDLLDVQWKGNLSDYITAIAWHPDGHSLAISSAAGEVALLSIPTQTIQFLQPETGHSVDCLAISADGQRLAAGGQDGTVRIWHMHTATPELITTLPHRAVWVDRLQWNPTNDHLAFGLGRYAQVWDAAVDQVVTTLNFASSSVLGLDWHPTGEWLALCGHRGARVWRATDWDEDPQVLDMPSASVAIAWSPDGQYLADGNLDSTLTVVEWARPEAPWVMQGFPGKVRQLVWSSRTTSTGAPLLAVCSAEAIVVWARDADESVGWSNQLLEAHEDTVQAIAFQPRSLLLASAGADGWVCLWHTAQHLAQVLEGADDGFSCLSWHPDGTALAAGGTAGEWLIWG